MLDAFVTDMRRRLLGGRAQVHKFSSKYNAGRLSASWPRKIALVVMAATGVTVGGQPALAQGGKAEPAPQAEAAPNPAAAAPAAAAAPQKFDIDEFRIDGADNMAQIEVEGAVYPFLGPQRSSDDVEKARAALEKAYHDKGFQTVSVSVPAQNVGNKVVVLTVTEGKVGRLRVANSRYFDLNKVKAKAPSLQEGTLPNFNEVTKDIVALNQWPDRRVTPALRAGATPGTVDVDLSVEDSLPFHGSVEINNRQSPNTSPTRLSASLRYDNLWQLGHSINLSFQTAPERPEDAQSFSGSYLARITDWTSLLVYGVDSDSDVATVGGLNVVGPGQIIGARGVLTLPGRENYFHSLSIGADYKHFGQIVSLENDTFSSPITYYPLNATYSGTVQLEKSVTQFSVASTLNLRGLGSDFDQFWDKRFASNASFVHFNVEASNTYELPKEFQVFGRVKGQVSDSALISSEQFSIGGLDTVRGYYESEAIGDNGIAGTLELRTPNFGTWLDKKLKDELGKSAPTVPVFNEWRAFAFIDGSIAAIYDPLPDQQKSFDLWSLGIGTRVKLFDHVDGTAVLAIPMADAGDTEAQDPRVLFSVSGEF